MLTQLTIRNLALIASAEIKLGEGFIAVTGETGAGKSVLLNGLRLVCGAKATTGMIRHGEEKAMVEGVFDLSRLPELRRRAEEMGIDCGEDELVVQREILSSGKNRARANGTQITLSDLQELGEQLVQMHGQSEQILLRDPRTQQVMLDNFCANAPLLERYTALWNEYTRLRAAMAQARERAASLAQQKDFLQFQCDELQKAALRPGEEEEHERLVQESSGSESRRRLMEEALTLLERENGLMDQIRELQGKLRQLQHRHPDTEALEPLVSAALDPLSSVQDSLRRGEKGHTHSPAEVEKANARLALIQKLKRKYRTDLPGLLSLRDQRRSELDALENLDSDLADLEHSANKVHGELLSTAAQLTASRQAGAGNLDAQVEERLRSLGMPQARFATRLSDCELGPLGAELAEFMMAPNKGEGMKPLRFSISGGELSRVLLAFKSVLAHRDRVPLLIFDEVDSGISGEIAHHIGDCLQGLGKYHQVLVITHLHQVASRAASQFKVYKSETEGRTYTHVLALDTDARIEELARMLGDAHSPTVRAHARQLLEETHAH